MSKPAPKLQKEEEPFIPYVELEDFDPILKERSEKYSQRMGFLPNCNKLYAHRPAIAAPLWDLNSAIMRDETSSLPQGLKRRIATRLGKLNNSTYCVSHHCGILQRADDEDRLTIELGEPYLYIGHLADANTHTEQALKRSRKIKQRGIEARALWLLGEIAMHRDPVDIEQAAIHYQQGLTLTEELGMRPLQAHCHRSLGTLYSQTRQSEQARAKLSTAIEMYRDMEMTFWLPETEAALAQVEKR